MSILNAENISHSFGGRQILEDASFRLLKGEHIGLIGANGEGKSTFLKIITGEMTPEEGTVEWCRHITYGYLDQYSTLEKGKTIRDALRDAFSHLSDLEAEMLKIYDKMAEASEEELAEMMEEVGEMQEILDSSGYYTVDTKISEYANGLGLSEIGLDRDVAELSGGQRAKVLLAKVLLENPMILILDEPTNFLDENHINWLSEFLQNYENAFILVSHDMPFLTKVTNVIYHLENTVLTRYKGTYEDFLRMYDLKKQQIEQAYKKQQKKIADLEDFVARNKARAATATLARSRQKELDKIERIELTPEKIKPTFNFQTDRAPGRVVISAEDLVIGYDAPLTKKIKIEIERNKKIAIRGVNGLGKSTLLKTLLKIIPPIEGEVHHDQFINVGYFEQEESASNKTALQEFWDEFPSFTNAEARAALAKCGLTTEHITTQMKVLSGGENAKVRLCKIMQRPANILVLDEPTNHLDILAKEELAKAIREFRGTVLLVCHEAEFYENVVDEVWDVSEWSTKVI